MEPECKKAVINVISIFQLINQQQAVLVLVLTYLKMLVILIFMS